MADSDNNMLVVDKQQLAAFDAYLKQFNFSDGEANKAIKQALRQSMSVIAKSVQNAVVTLDSTSGNTPDPQERNDRKKGVKTTVFKYGEGARVDITHGVWVSRRKSKKHPELVKRGMVLSWIDEGRRPGSPDRWGHSSKGSQPHHFFAMAVSLKKAEASANFMNFLQRKIEKMAKAR